MATNSNQDLRFKLLGIQAEKANTQAYLNQLTELEKTVQDQLMTGSTGTPSRGTAKAATAKTGGTLQKRKRTISPEQRKKMSEAAKSRWAQRKGQAPATGSAPAQTTTSAPVLQPPAGMQDTSTVQ